MMMALVIMFTLRTILVEWVLKQTNTKKKCFIVDFVKKAFNKKHY